MTAVRSYSSAFKTGFNARMPSEAKPSVATAATREKDKRFMICFPSWGRSRAALVQVPCRTGLVHECKRVYFRRQPCKTQKLRGSFYPGVIRSSDFCPGGEQLRR